MADVKIEEYLVPDAIIDSDNETVKAHVSKVVGTLSDPLDCAIKLYYAARDGIRYDPYTVSSNPEAYKASATLKRGRGFCVQKAALLCAFGRACRIPSRLGFANVRNHLASKQLIEFVGSNLFVFHGYTEFYLEGKWVKATPAFNETLCERYQVAPLDFNGREDSIFQAYSMDRKLFMEYTDDYGTFPTIPIELMIRTWRELYGDDRVEAWFRYSTEHMKTPLRDFYKEEPVIP